MYSQLLEQFLHDEYFRNVLCLVLRTFDGVDAMRNPVFGVEVIDVDVAIRNAGGLADGELLSVREYYRLRDIQRMDVLKKKTTHFK